MLSVPVVWVDYPADGKDINRGYWDQGLLERILDRTVWRPADPVGFVHHEGFVDADGAVVILAGRYHAGDVDRFNADIARYRWCVVIVTSDEESLFPVDRIEHPAMALWAMTPRPYLDYPAGTRFIGEGWKADTPEILSAVEPERDLDWFFAGQVTHEQRKRAAAQMRRMPGGLLEETPGFTLGMPRAEYLANLTRARVAPCPSGPQTPDSFRAFEALEAGCVPIVDAYCPAYDGDGYWPMLFPGEPFPVIHDWDDLPGYTADVTVDKANEVFAWWQGYKRSLTLALDDDIRHLAGGEVHRTMIDDQVTVLIPTSPIPAHPDTSIIEETIASVRHHLPHAEIVVMIDGVREEQEARRDAYRQYVARLLWKCQHEWSNVLPVLHGEHLHQAEMTRRALVDQVRTPLVLFVEHDTPLVTDEPIPWHDVADLLTGGYLDLVRFHFEAHIPEPHQHLMLDPSPREIEGVPIIATVQWSQRPHLATVAYYRHILDTYFTPADRTMIEDVMHSIVQRGWFEHDELAWYRNRIGIYAPEGNFKRSLNLDGRGDDPKFSMVHQGQVIA